MNTLLNRLTALLLLFALVSFAPPRPAAESINWLTVEEAEALSEKEPRKILMDVYTDWCGWCKKMDKTTFANDEVAKYVNENFYAVKLKADSNDKVTFKGKEYSKGELAQAFRVTGYPTIVFFDQSFSKFQPVSGYRGAKDFLALLEQFNAAE